MPIRPLVKYHGGKGRLHKWILSHFVDHEVYVEPFGGAASVLLNKKPASREVYSEIDSAMFNLMRIVQTRPAELVAKLRELTYCKEQFESSRDIHLAGYPGLDEMQRAVECYALKRMSMGGLCDWFSWSNRVYSTGPEPIQTWNVSLDNVSVVSRRLQGVEIRNQDGFEVIQEFDDPNCLIYLDPPYIHDVRYRKKAYDFEMSNEQHERLAQLANASRAKILISGYRHPSYEQWYANWNLHVKNVANHASRVENKPQMMECLWSNF